MTNPPHSSTILAYFKTSICQLCKEQVKSEAKFFKEYTTARKQKMIAYLAPLEILPPTHPPPPPPHQKTQQKPPQTTKTTIQKKNKNTQKHHHKP